MYNYENALWRHKCFRHKLRGNRLSSLKNYRKIRKGFFRSILINYDKFINNKSYSKSLLKKLEIANDNSDKLYGWIGNNSSFADTKSKIKLEKKIFEQYVCFGKAPLGLKIKYTLILSPYLISHFFRNFVFFLKIFTLTFKGII